MRACEHWDALAGQCFGRGHVRVRARDEGCETWEGWLCAEHLAEYRADPDTSVEVVAEA